MSERSERRSGRSTLRGYKACRSCRAVVPESEVRCPVCGGSDFTSEWLGLVVIIDAERSCLAKALGIKSKGMYAIEIP